MGLWRGHTSKPQLLQNIEHVGPETAEDCIGERQAQRDRYEREKALCFLKIGPSTMLQQPLTIVSAHIDFQLSATRQPPPQSFPSLPLSPSLNPWELGGAKNRAGSSLQQGADSACSPSPSSTPSDSETDSGCCPELATSGQLYNVLHIRDARLNRGTFPLWWALTDSAYQSTFYWRREGTAGWWCGLSKHKLSGKQ